jgi:hypothetical protein
MMSSPARVSLPNECGRAVSAAQTHHQGTVLVGFAESLAAIESVWTLLEAGFAVVAFSRAGARPPLRRDSRVGVRNITSPQDDARQAAADLVALATEVAPVAVLPLDDEAVWLCDVASRSQGFPPVAGPTGTAAELALDKRKQLAMASDAGMPVPATVIIGPSQFAMPAVPDSPGPWILKPALAVRERDGRLTKTAGTLLDTEGAVRAAAEEADEPLLVQPRILGVGEGVFGHAYPGDVAAWSGHRRIRMMNPSGSGSSACRSIDPDQTLLDAASKFMAAAEWNGLFMLEYLRDRSGDAWFMELNGRPWGSMVLARHRGLPYPVWAVRAVLDPHYRPPEPSPGPHVTARHLGRELLHLAFVTAKRNAHRNDPEWPQVIPTARAVLGWRRDERFYNLSKGHPSVFLADTWSTAMRPLINSRRAGR